MFSPFLLKARDARGGTIKSTTLGKQRKVHYSKSEKSHLLYMCLVSPDHTHTCVVWVKLKQLEAEDWESALNSSNLHGNVMSALPFDHRKCVPTKGLTPALLKIRIRFYNYYQLQSAAWQQMLHTGVLMWMAVGISQTKDFTLWLQVKRTPKKHIVKVIYGFFSSSFSIVRHSFFSEPHILYMCYAKPTAHLWSLARSLWEVCRECQYNGNSFSVALVEVCLDIRIKLSELST